MASLAGEEVEPAPVAVHIELLRQVRAVTQAQCPTPSPVAMSSHVRGRIPLKSCHRAIVPSSSAVGDFSLAGANGAHEAGLATDHRLPAGSQQPARSSDPASLELRKQDQEDLRRRERVVERVVRPLDRNSQTTGDR
jgi:hypothetical protein